MIMLYRQFIRKIVLDILSYFSIPQNGIHILNGHYLSVFDEDPIVFFNLLNELKKNCHFIKIEEAVNLIENKIKVNKCYVAFTFDDGFEECYTKIAPVLNDYNVNAAFFIIPNFIEGDLDYVNNMCLNTLNMPKVKKPLNWKQVEELKQSGFIIGSHTLNHLRLVTTDEEILKLEVVNSKKIIEERLNIICEYFAFGYGRLEDVSENAIKIINATYRYKFTQTNYKKYFSINNQFINRRHFEGNWPSKHLNYFLAKKSF